MYINFIYNIFELLNHLIDLLFGFRCFTVRAVSFIHFKLGFPLERFLLFIITIEEKQLEKFKVYEVNLQLD